MENQQRQAYLGRSGQLTARQGDPSFRPDTVSDPRRRRLDGRAEPGGASGDRAMRQQAQARMMSTRAKMSAEKRKNEELVASVRLDPLLFNDHRKTLQVAPRLPETERGFFMSQLETTSDDDLIEHIACVQDEAYKTYPNECTSSWGFALLKMRTHTSYQYVLDLQKQRKDAIFLDLGCGLGTDVRKLVADGFPILKILATDTRPELWLLGEKLFRIPSLIRFVGWQLTDPKYWGKAEVQYTPPMVTHGDLSTVKKLSQLHNQATYIHAGYLFHELPPDHQKNLARRIATLLCGMSGCIIFGAQPGSQFPGDRADWFSGYRTNLHSPESWERMWDGVFAKGSVRFATSLKRRDHYTEMRSHVRDIRQPEGGSRSPPEEWILEWSIIRV
ncbi:hypothetical protein JAAARDRAFT_29345 [Jaapia argillacea MUCL 33604]|uniref:Methyltransferase domain-containing protein n=1 Tax=Jaapia argillacea MUCL 33604 TaxID=933084 RepID=A0A067QIH8_9AGAM|nr:hypothetical protein JAAARDRAFT_29345 [Jaapia argillacea MUCL 33604]